MLATIAGDGVAGVSARAEVVQAVAAFLGVFLSAGALIVSTLALWVSFRLLAQLKLAKEQLEQTRELHDKQDKWNRLASTVGHFFNVEFERTRMNARVALKEKLGIRLYFHQAPLTESQIASILGDDDLFESVMMFLNLLEDYAEAVSRRVIDPEYAYSNMSSVVLKMVRIFEPLIREDQRREGDGTSYGSLIKLARNWAGGAPPRTT